MADWSGLGASPASGSDAPKDLKEAIVPLRKKEKPQAQPSAGRRKPGLDREPSSAEEMIEHHTDLAQYHHQAMMHHFAMMYHHSNLAAEAFQTIRPEVDLRVMQPPFPEAPMLPADWQIESEIAESEADGASLSGFDVHPGSYSAYAKAGASERERCYNMHGAQAWDDGSQSAASEAGDDFVDDEQLSEGEQRWLNEQMVEVLNQEVEREVQEALAKEMALEDAQPEGIPELYCEDGREPTAEELQNFFDQVEVMEALSKPTDSVFVSKRAVAEALCKEKAAKLARKAAEEAAEMAKKKEEEAAAAAAAAVVASGKSGKRSGEGEEDEDDDDDDDDDVVMLKAEKAEKAGKAGAGEGPQAEPASPEATGGSPVAMPPADDAPEGGAPTEQAGAGSGGGDGGEGEHAGQAGATEAAGPEGEEAAPPPAAPAAQEAQEANGGGASDDGGEAESGAAGSSPPAVRLADDGGEEKGGA